MNEPEFNMRDARAEAWWESVRVRAASPGWRERARCRGWEVEAITPKTCRGCPVLAACLGAELVYSRDIGAAGKGWYHTYGGMTPRGRKMLVRYIHRHQPRTMPVKPIEHGTDSGYKTHLRRGEDACMDCLRAHAAKNPRKLRLAS